MTPEQADLCERHLDLARLVAAATLRGKPSNITYDDLLGAAYEGLVQAALSYDPSKSDSFVSWARRRLNGAVLDALRREDLLPRSQRRALAGQTFAAVVPLEAAGEPHSADHADQVAASVTVRQTLRKAPLSPTQAVALADHQAEIPQAVTAAALGLTCSRVSQLRYEALRVCREHLGGQAA